MEQHLRQTAEEFRKANPYSEEELLDIIRTCQRAGADGYASVEAEVSVIYWYYIDAICASLCRLYPSPDAYFDRDDLISEAVLHLFDAIRTYNTWGEVPFRSWIMRISKNAAGRFIYENQTKLRIPRSFAKKITGYLEYTAARIMKDGERPSRKEIMEALSFTDEECRILERYIRLEPKPDEPWTGPEDIIDVDEEGQFRSVEQQAVDLYIRNALQDILKEALTPEENRFLSMSLGLNGCTPCSVDDLAERFGVTPDEIFAGVHVIREKLKADRHIQKLAECYGSM